jgi:D-xylose transport system ATP-binding protein
MVEAAGATGERTGGLLLEARGLSKRFGGVVALDGVDFTLRRGEVHALCGENGAGKSTLIKILCGIHPHGSHGGSLFIDGQAQRFDGVADATAAGLAVIHQELALVPQMTVAENLFLGQEPRRVGLVDHDRMLADAEALLARHGIDVPPAARVESLGVGQRQLVEIARALRRDSRVLLLDEPTAALTEREVEVLLAIVRGLAAKGVGCIYISHRLDEVFAIADRITVLRDGRSIVTLDAARATREEVIGHMVGRRIKDLFPRRRREPGEHLFTLDNLTVAPSPGAAPRLTSISLELRAGEVLGIGGLMGAGRSELLMHLFGLWGHRVGGEVRLGGAPLARSPRECIAQGLVLITEDRKRYGLVLQQTVGFNLSLSDLARLAPRGVLDHDREEAANDEFMRRLRIRAAGQDTITATLSGGNQQKVMLGKSLMTRPKVVLLDEPTRGIDVGAKLEIYELINDLTDQGLAVLLVSSELPELMGMSDRIVMLADGAVGGRFDRRPWSQQALIEAAMASPAARRAGAAGGAGR